MIKDSNPGDKKTRAAAMKGIQKLARDHARTPMQWNDSHHGGFTSGTPWMAVNDSYLDINVARQLGDKNSVLGFWRKMIALRKEYGNLFIYGKYVVDDFDNPHTYCFYKVCGNQKAYIALNFTSIPQPFVMPQCMRKSGHLVVSNADYVQESTMSPYEGRIYTVD